MKNALSHALRRAFFMSCADNTAHREHMMLHEYRHIMSTAMRHHEAGQATATPGSLPHHQTSRPHSPKTSLASAFSSGEIVAPCFFAAARFSVMSRRSLVSLAMSPGFSPRSTRSTIRPVWRPIV